MSGTRPQLLNSSSSANAAGPEEDRAGSPKGQAAVPPRNIGDHGSVPADANDEERLRSEDIDLDDLVLAVEEAEAAARMEDEPATMWQKQLDERKLEQGCDRKSFNIVGSGIAHVSSKRFYAQAVLEEFSETDEAEGAKPGIYRSFHDVVRFAQHPQPVQVHAACLRLQQGCRADC
eukprot:TRINITY_DN23870_c0_g5_i1.p1 TRINITY_DN23870_c0_g5~~TRINITY_DN23870_c0_g5_i1.p1  ORF type:complete len:193 (-),score=23.84 TRINITY_DN23870_c0_g5_i1:528-1055(-)